MPLQPSSINPIGIFDSGVGGLSVLREIRRELPQENLLYVADSGHAPYGDKSRQFIEARSIAITEFLIGQGVKAVVVACNTASGAAVETLRARFAVPIVAMEPAIKPAVARTQSGVIGVLATSRTLDSESFIRLTARYGADADILVQACPGLVEQVEAGELAGEQTRELLTRYLEPLLAQRADTIVLGCTHYPFLAPLIQEIAGSSVEIIDPAGAIARELRRRLSENQLLTGDVNTGMESFWTSAAPDMARRIIAQLWHKDVTVMRLPDASTDTAN